MSNLLKTDQRHFILKECVREKKKLEKKIRQNHAGGDTTKVCHRFCSNFAQVLFFLVNGSG